MYNIATTQQSADGIKHLTNRALVAAHLLTGSPEQAEQAVLEGIDSWNPDEEPEEALFDRVVEAAVRPSVQQIPSAADDQHLPRELRPILKLAPQPRSCFVLRILLGLPSKVCGRLLGLDSDRADEYTIEALECLGSDLEDVPTPQRWRKKTELATR